MSNAQPTPRDIARKVLRRPEIMMELLILIAWTDPEGLADIQQMIETVRQRNQGILAACAAGTFGRDYVYSYTPEEAAELGPKLDRRLADAYPKGLPTSLNCTENEGA